MKRPYVIAINAVSGGGKTALAKLLHESLPGSVLLCFDDFDATNVYPEDFYEWSKRGGHLSEFDCPGLGETVEKEIRQGTAEYIVLDYPFGRDHPRLSRLIDLSVYVDTPLDVAMARRILRDYTQQSGGSTEVLGRLREEMAHYLTRGRYPYLDGDRHKQSSDLILDGWLALEQLRDEILARIERER